MEISTTKELIQSAIDSANKEHSLNMELSSITKVSISISGIALETINGQQYFQSWEVIKLNY